MGTTYAAFDRLLGRYVAVKVPRGGAHASRWPARARLLREASALQRVRHAHVVELLDVHIDADIACIVMAPIDGAPLGERRLDWRGIVALGIQIGDALAAVHDAGLVHRDVTPRNILVDRERAWLIDFGLARPIDAAAMSDDLLALALSPAGAPAGTPAFMAPEQRRGAAPAPSADVYGLCATLQSALARGGDPGPPHLTHLLRWGASEDPAQRPTSVLDLVRMLRAI